jgi:hypothetical protein
LPRSIEQVTPTERRLARAQAVQLQFAADLVVYVEPDVLPEGHAADQQVE